MHSFLKELGIEDLNSGACGADWLSPGGDRLPSENPTTGETIATVVQAVEADYEQVVTEAQRAFRKWRMVPGPKRGEFVRDLGLALREYKKPLGALVSLEMGKIRAEGEGEVQEMIDMADFAVGLSRQLYGLTMQSERPRHRMMEQWHPLGLVGVVTAFNFPVAVWAWNALLAAVCGDAIIWKPSSKTPLTAIAVQRIAHRVALQHDCAGLFGLTVGRGSAVGERLINDPRIPLVSATGSCRMGRHIGEAVAKRLGRSLLELGGNNAVIVTDDADLDLAIRGVLFGAVGTAGQRCTSTRRVLLQKGVAEEFTRRLLDAYGQVSIGDPLEEGTLMGPLVDSAAVDTMMEALDGIRSQGGEVLCGGRRIDRPGHFVEPTIVRAPRDLPLMQEETFAPILYLVEFESLEEALEIHNDVPQGLSSSIFTNSLRAAEAFLSPEGSDCGIANVNLGTSGAEIGGAFGGEKDTGGGRESGSDAWKIYMRRQTNTVNWGRELPLAQGISFGD
jgi:aldehyde dehydrogenase (NAD+)